MKVFLHYITINRTSFSNVGVTDICSSLPVVKLFAGITVVSFPERPKPVIPESATAVEPKVTFVVLLENTNEGGLHYKLPGLKALINSTVGLTVIVKVFVFTITNNTFVLKCWCNRNCSYYWFCSYVSCCESKNISTALS